MRLTRADLAGVVLLGLVAVVGLTLLPTLPDRFAVHFGTGGPNSFVSPLVGVLLLPAVGVGTVVVVRLTSEGRGTDGVAASYGLLLSSFFAYVQGVVLAWNLGYPVNVTLAVLPAAAAFVVVSLVVNYR
jgi:hypothetical protein